MRLLDDTDVATFEPFDEPQFPQRALTVEQMLFAARREGDELLFSVLDRGKGFSAEEADKLFTPFYRSPSARARAAGVGIGLAVCKRLIEAQGGRMWARPREGGGADIGFALPIVAEGLAE